jgi:hypothetical protein
VRTEIDRKTAGFYPAPTLTLQGCPLLAGSWLMVYTRASEEKVTIGKSVRPTSNGGNGRLSNGTSSPPCSNCAALADQVVSLRAEHESTLLALVREREKLNALRLSHVARQIYEPPPPPLRHQIVDQLNLRLKRFLGPMHSVTKSAISSVIGRVGRATPR